MATYTRAEINANYYQRNKVKIAKNMRKYYENNIDKKLEYGNNYYKEHRQEMLDKQAEYRKNKKLGLLKKRGKRVPFVRGNKPSEILSKLGLTLDDVKKIANS